MAGLIESIDYSVSKARLIANVAGANSALEALEWRLLQAISCSEFQVVDNGSPPLHALSVDQSPSSPALVLIFTTELFEGEEKILLLDVREAQLDPDDDDD